MAGMPGTYVLNCGNRRSVIKALEHLGAEIYIDNEPVLDCDRIIIPGVGTMASVMTAIKPVRDALEAHRHKGTPILGICAGMHAFCRRSDEGVVDGLAWWDWVDVECIPEPSPRQGWDKSAWGTFYFSHSYAIREWDVHDWIFEHGDKVYVSHRKRDNLMGCQFHPEKSQADGLAFLKRFIEWTP